MGKEATDYEQGLRDGRAEGAYFGTRYLFVWNGGAARWQAYNAGGRRVGEGRGLAEMLLRLALVNDGRVVVEFHQGSLDDAADDRRTECGSCRRYRPRKKAHAANNSAAAPVTAQPPGE